MTTNVIHLHPASNIPLMLRQMADEIEAGDKPRSMFAFTVDDRSEFKFYGWGSDLNINELVGILALAQHRFIGDVVEYHRGLDTDEE